MCLAGVAQSQRMTAGMADHSFNCNPETCGLFGLLKICKDVSSVWRLQFSIYLECSAWMLQFSIYLEYTHGNPQDHTALSGNQRLSCSAFVDIINPLHSIFCVQLTVTGITGLTRQLHGPVSNADVLAADITKCFTCDSLAIIMTTTDTY